MLETRFHRFLCSHPKNLISDLFKQQVYCIIQRDAVPDMFGLVIFLCIIIHQCAGLRRWTIKPFWDQTVRVCFSCFPRKITGRSDFVPTCKNCSHSISLTLRLDLLFSIIRRLKKKSTVCIANIIVCKCLEHFPVKMYNWCRIKKKFLLV